MITKDVLNAWKLRSDATFPPPVDKNKIDRFEEKICLLPPELKDFYSLSNGLETEIFKIFPFFDENNPKKTWDSLERVNDSIISKDKYDDQILSNFIIFAKIGGPYVALINKQDNSIWFEDEDGFHQTDLSLREFINGFLNED